MKMNKAQGLRHRVQEIEFETIKSLPHAPWALSHWEQNIPGAS